MLCELASTAAACVPAPGLASVVAEAPAGPSRTGSTWRPETRRRRGDAIPAAVVALDVVPAAVPSQGVLPAAVVERDALLWQLAWLRHGLVLPLAQAAASLSSHSGWLACGFLIADDFCRTGFGRTGRWFDNLVRLHEATERLPALRAAVAGTDGHWPLGQMAALGIARVATQADVGSWIERARSGDLETLRQELKETLAERGRAPSATPAQEPHVETRVLWHLEVPPEVALAHEAVRDLHRAVVGRETGLGGFAEAVIGEVSDRGLARLEDFRPRFVRLDAPPSRQDEAGSAQRGMAGGSGAGLGASMSGRGCTMAGDGCTAATHARIAAWDAGTAASDGNDAVSGQGARPPRSRLRQRCQATPGMRRAERVLVEFDQLEVSLERLVRGLERTCMARGTAHKIQRLVAVFRKLVRLENRLEIALGDLLLEQQEDGSWDLLGYDGLASYAEERLGLGRTAAWSRVRLARQLRQRPDVREAYASGRLGLEKAQLVVRMLRDRPGAPVGAWVEAASRTTVRRLRQEERLLQSEVLQARAAVAQSLKRGHGTRGDGGVGGVGASAARAWADVGRFPAGLPLRHEPVDDATWRESLRRVPGKTRDEIFRLGFGLAERVAREGPLLPVALNLVLPETQAVDLRCWVETVRRKLTEQPLRTPAEECRLWPAERIANSFVGRTERVPEWVAYLAVLQVCAVVWDEPKLMTERDSVAERDGWQCMAPGCTARADLQRHHLVYRSDGGGDEDENRLLLCLAHHMLGEHGGLARCRGRAPLDVIWRLGWAELGTWWRNDRRIERPT